MKILGLETSCDETAAAIVESGTKVLANSVATSSNMHAKTGGIIPEIAARQQIKSILPVISDVLIQASGEKESGVQKWAHKNIDAIAVTVGPGLIGSLLVGIETAKTLGFVWNKKLIGVNHLVGHIYANWLTAEKLPRFPALALVVSGGHTDLVFIKSHGDIKWIGGTRDDAAGEAFDKTARLLNLPYPGGPAIAQEAEKFLKKNSGALTLFPRPMVDDATYDWSFSGLKTAVLTKTKGRKIGQEQFAAEVQEAIVDSLVIKTLRAVDKFKPKSFLLAGGVAANKRLRDKFESEIQKQKPAVDFRVPEFKYCTDNAAYIAACAFFNTSGTPWQDLTANPNLPITDQT